VVNRLEESAVKALLTLVLMTSSVAFAQNNAALAAAEAACGPKEIKFDAKQDSTQHPTPQPDADKALIYVVQEIGEIQCKSCALTKVGLNGTWMGANQGSSYFFFPATPGENHLCLNWQSRLEVHARAVALVNFTAEAGKVYYFRARIFPGHQDYSFDLDPINSDQGKLLIALSAFSNSRPRVQRTSK
jgi:hypothetical protein